jgi:iron complex outermembrane receptor protein
MIKLNRNKFKPENLIFRKWGRKGYSVYNSLKRIVLISVLSFVYFLSVILVVDAQEKDSTEIKLEYDLDEIEVSGQRAPAVFSQVARVITVIEQKEIEALPQQSIQDVLEYFSAVDVRQRGTEGVQADVSIRGGTFDQTLVLLNGINITDPQSGHHNFNLPVGLSQIERIEILEGPAARVYGPNAFSGAINLVTKKAHSDEAEVNICGGSFGYFNTGLSGTLTSEKLGHLISFNRKRSDGFIKNTDFKQSDLYYSNQYTTLKGDLEFQTGYSQKGFGANSFYTPKYPNQYEETNVLFTSATFISEGKFHLTPTVYYRRHQDRFELFRENPASWYTGHNYHLTQVYGGMLNSWIQRKYGKTAFGAEYRSENIFSNVLGEMMQKPKEVPGENAFFTKSKSRVIISVFFEHSIFLNGWSLNAGALVNRYSFKDLTWKIFPGLDVSKNLTENIKFFTSYNTSLRLPTFTDLYYTGPTNIGNSELKPEESSTIEGGLKWSGKIISGHGVLFYRNGRDIIDWIKYSPQDKWQPQNLTQISHTGAEFSLKISPGESWGKLWPNQIRLNYFYQNGKKNDNTIISNYVLDYLKHKLVGSLNQSIGNNITIDLKMLVQDRSGSFISYSRDSNGVEQDYSPFLTCDVKINYRKKAFQLFVSANNIFNAEYYDIGNVVQPGRWLKTGISYKIGFK